VKHIFVDGTHAIGPQGTQVLTVLGLTTFGVVVPLGYCVTNGATMVHHMYLLEQLAGMGLTPTHVHVDYERAEQQAVKAVFPNARIVGCFFHFLQAVRRQYIQYCGAIKENDKVWESTHELLSRLYKSTTQEMFEHNIEALRLFCEKHKHGRFWNEYFFKTWIKKFHLTTWSMIGEKDPDARQIRTNNFAESWNNHLKHVTFEGLLNLGLDKVCDGLHQSLRTATIDINKRTRVHGFGLELESFVPEEDEGGDQNVAIPTDNGTLEIP
jgi:hypothetical protein